MKELITALRARHPAAQLAARLEGDHVRLSVAVPPDIAFEEVVSLQTIEESNCDVARPQVTKMIVMATHAAHAPRDARARSIEIHRAEEAATVVEAIAAQIDKTKGNASDER